MINQIEYDDLDSSKKKKKRTEIPWRNYIYKKKKDLSCSDIFDISVAQGI